MFVLMLFAWTSATTFAQTFKKVYSPDDGAKFEAVFGLDEHASGFYLGGASQPAGRFVVKTDATGTVLWSRGTVAQNAVGGVVAAPDGGVVLLETGAENSAVLRKLDAAGNEVWARAYNNVISVGVSDSQGTNCQFCNASAVSPTLAFAEPSPETLAALAEATPDEPLVPAPATPEEAAAFRAHLLKIAGDSLPDMADPDVRYLRNSFLFDVLKNDPAYLAEPLLAARYDSLVGTNFPVFAEIDTLLSNGNFAAARSMKAAVTSGNEAETFLKTSNEALAYFYLNDSLPENAEKTLADIAVKCYSRYGKAVERARGVLCAALPSPPFFADECAVIPVLPTERKAGIAESVKQSLKVYPNPAQTNFDFTPDVSGTLRVFDPIGREILKEVRVKAEETLNLSTEKWGAGLYVLRFSEEPSGFVRIVKLQIVR